MHTPRISSTLLIRRNVSEALLQWSGDASPWVSLAVDPTMFGYSRVAILNIGLPCVASGGAESEYRLQQALLSLYHEYSEASQAADRSILMRGVNVSGLAARLLAGFEETPEEPCIQDKRPDLEHST